MIRRVVHSQAAADLSAALGFLALVAGADACLYLIGAR